LLANPILCDLLGADGGHMRVLIVDDHVDTADMLQMLLGVAGHDVKVAYRGEDAIQVATGFAPELALVDIHLPDISGFAVAKQIRKIAGRRVNIIAMSGGDTRKLSLTGNFDQHAQKPVSAARLYQLIDEVREATKVA
jgi:DNA-binding response OmpR family regulator